MASRLTRPCQHACVAACSPPKYESWLDVAALIALGMGNEFKKTCCIDCNPAFESLIDVFFLQVFDGMEVCSGKGLLSQVLRHGGYRIANFDILDWDGYAAVRQPSTTTNPLDLLQPSGMALPGHMRWTSFHAMQNERVTCLREHQSKTKAVDTYNSPL